MLIENLLIAYNLDSPKITNSHEREFNEKFGHIFIENDAAYIFDYVDGEEGDSKYSEFGHTVDGVYTVTYQESVLPGDRIDYNFNFEYINKVCPDLKEWIITNFNQVPNHNGICYYPIFRKDINGIVGDAVAVVDMRTYLYSITTTENLSQYGYVCIGGQAFLIDNANNGVYTLAKHGKSMQQGYASAEAFWENRPQTIYLPKDIIFND